MTNRGGMLAVDTFGKYGTFSVKLPSRSSSVLVKDLLNAMGEQMKLKESSYRHFALHLGPLGRPKAKLDSQDSVLGIDGPLCLQRTGQDISRELKILKNDDVAVHLLYSEALHYFYQTPSKFQPTTEERQTLEEFCDPSFPTERQFIEAAMTVRGYTAIQIGDCIITSHIEHRGVTIAANSPVTCTCYEEVFQIEDVINKAVMQWEWRAIKKWKQLQENEVEFLLCLEQGNASILTRISLVTDQATYLLQAALEICTHILYKMKPQSKPIEVATRQKDGDPKQEFLNYLFGNHPRFTSLEPRK